MKFKDNGVGPCSDCKGDVNVNSDASPATETTILCPRCKSNYIEKQKVEDGLNHLMGRCKLHDNLWHEIDSMKKELRLK